MVLIQFIYILGLLLPFHQYFSRKKLRIFRHLGDGEALLFQVQNLLYSQQGKLPSGVIELPQYKFYTDILLMVLECARQFGGEILVVLRQVQSGLRKELIADQRLRSELFSGLAQFVAISLITWGFAFLTQSYANIHLDSCYLVGIAVWQLLGIGIYFLLYTFYQRKALRPYWLLTAILYRLRSGSSAGLPARQVMGMVGDYSLGKAIPTPLRVIHQRLQTLIYLYSQLGQGICQETGFLLEDLWELYQEAQRSFFKRLAAIRFLILAVFFLSAHLIFFLGVAGSFLIEEV